ncbi:MAG TPA: IPTL-CTERM sorting domain-containing protein [Syntrophales bacterium]|nr:IPTL-CTERM sorting domain-containing protein [Syntrophales bacterium]
MKAASQWRVLAVILVVSLITVELTIPGITKADDTGWVSPTTVPAFSEVDNPTNALDDGGGYARFHTAGTYDYANYSGFSFSIPADSVITAITVRLDAWGEPPPYDFGRFFVQISPNGSDWYYKPSIKPDASETTYEIGNDLWGHTWAASDFSGSFVVQLQNSGFDYSYLDWIAVKVTYGQAVTPIPTLSEWGLIIFALLMVVTAGVFMRRRKDMTA